MIKKIIIFLIIVLCSVTCSSHNSTIFLNNDYKTIHKRAQCNPESNFPQMIIIPYFDQASQIVPNCETYPVHKTAFALFIFYHQWLKYFEDNNMAIRGALEEIMIKWGTEKRLGKRGYDLHGERYENRNVIGLVEADSIIWVWQGYNHRISESALMHELVHIALRVKNGTADPDHEGHKYRGWTKLHTYMIIEAKQILRAFEL